jgi:predicted alpha/beta superfamily hydrolase
MRTIDFVAAVLLCALAASGAQAEEKASTAGPTVRVMTPPLLLPGLQRARTLRVYLPPDYATSDRRYPVIYLHDGQNVFDAATSYAGEWGVDETLDALARDDGFAAIAVAIDHGGERRINELSAWPHHELGAGDGDLYLDDLVYRIKPFIDANYRTQPQREATAIVGSSLGGLASHYAIHRHPEVFGKAAVFSPSYWVSAQVYIHTRNVELPDDAKVYLHMGGAEGEQALADVTRMHEQMRAEGLDERQLTLHIADAAEHNEKAWREEFPRAVRWLFETDEPAATIKPAAE